MGSERRFDELAENYDRREEIRGDPLEPWLRRTLPPGGRAAVDLACGAGRHTIVLAQSYERVLGVDLSRQMIELARRRRPAANVDYRTADLLDVSGQFDLVFSSAALHDVPDLDRALTHIRSLVATGGRAIVADVVAPLSPIPRWWFRGAAIIYLLLDLVRRRPHAFELYRLESDPAWTAHLATDRYLSRSEFERRYTDHFPDAVFHGAQHLQICTWENR